jgi:hypothetical protein
VISNTPTRQKVSIPAPQVFSRVTKSKPANNGEGYRLPKKYTIPGEVIQDESTGQLRPKGYKGQVRSPSDPTGHLSNLVLEDTRYGELKLSINPSQEEKDGRFPRPRARHRCKAGHGMDKPRLHKGHQRSHDAGLHGPPFHVSVSQKPLCRRSEPESEFLMPPGAPEAREAAVQKLSKGSAHGREMPGVDAEAEYRRSQEGEK